MKKLLISLILSLLFPVNTFAQTSNLQTIDQVNNFKSEIIINKDTSISIKETIDYETNLNKHGIYRYIPIRYSQKGLNYTTKIKNLKIIDATDNSSIPYSTSYEDGSVTYKIGDPDQTFTGKKTYIISYTVENALKKFEKYDELYWDIVGEGWKVPVLNSQAFVKSPFAKITSATCASGIFGSNDKQCNFSYGDNEANFAYNQTINYGSNITVLVALSQTDSQIVFPTKLEIIIKSLKDNFFLIFIPIPAIIIFLLWFYKGRDLMFLSPNVFDLDPAKSQTLKPLFYQHRTPLVYEPLKDLTPGEAGGILDEKIDNQDIISEIIDLARQKYLKIERLETKQLFGKKEDYKFTKIKSADDKLPKHQTYLLDEIFKSKDEKLLSDLKGSFYNQMTQTRNLLNDSLKNKNLFSANPAGTRILYIALSIFLNFGGFILAVVTSPITGSGIPIFLAVISSIISLIIASQMPQKTAIGTNLMLQAKGLQRTIKLGEWREKIKEQKLFIEQILPFAISLGVVKELANDMAKLNIESPSYLGTNTMSNFTTYSFINSFTREASSNLSYNPTQNSSSRSWSGGSGFSGGGGGSSGGGGGGGGGGSW